ncbi:DUF3037 domain-containing protein [Pseudomonas nunensis]|uniref:DUF3037 domain-containing protein n=1 Tax=Pseudomonas nunensis TaxID=2961896 RepID=UPI0025B00A12|nr:DUF3037 domain-containing protein [Pseudomonas nunensis]MDN3223496.1 DUF3037 domain-containing protein [Pseudomonas nunensis]
MKFKSYDFSILKYVHDRITGEFVNIGVVIYCKEEKLLKLKCKSRTTRVSAVFPDLDRNHLKSVLRHITKRFDEINSRIKTGLDFEGNSPLSSFIFETLKDDDSSLQWSKISSGLSLSPTLELDKIFKRYVCFHDTPDVRDRRTEQDIWRDFEKHLKKFVPPETFSTKKISVLDDELEFKHAWKNGIWHCVEPVSFDLSDGDNMKDKAHRWLGQMTSIQNSHEEFKLYLIISKPKEQKLTNAFNKALSILRKIPTDKEIFLEDETDKLALEMKSRFDKHNQITIPD